jgi:hypothetical protein
MEPSPVSCAKPPIFAPWLSARMALADSAPKLMAEMLNTLASYGCVHGWWPPSCCGVPPITMRKSWFASLVGCIEWLIHS